MNVVAPAVGRATPLPRVADYLRAVLNLGRRSLRPALPALAFLYFYRVGMGAYMALSGDTYVIDSGAVTAVVPRLAIIASFLPLLLLVYTPFLPLQDSVLEGRPITFGAAMRRTLENAWPWTLSGLAQATAVFIPFAIVCVLGGLLMPDTTGEPTSRSVILFAFIVVLGGIWFVIAGILLMFATPAVVLDGQGPVQSIRSSARLVLSHLGAVLGRLLAFLFLAILTYIVVTMPAQMLLQLEQASGSTSVPIKLAVAVWSSAADTLLFPFWVAALMVLYRSLVPAAGGSVPGAVGSEDEPHGPRASSAPFE